MKKYNKIPINCIDRIITGTLFLSFIFLTNPLFAINFNAVSNEEALSAPCKYSDGMQKKWRDEYFQKLETDKNIEAGSVSQVYGVTFQNESPVLIRGFLNLTTPVDENEKLISSYNENLNLKYKIPASCKKVRCALNSIFGSSKADKILYLLMVYDVNTSHLVFQKSAALTDQELDVFLFTFDLLPPFLRKVDDNKKMVHLLRDKKDKLGAANVLANSAMEFYNTWSQLPLGSQVYVVMHELAHNWARTRIRWPFSTYSLWLNLNNSEAFNNRMDFSSEWILASGWQIRTNQKGENEIKNENPGELISGYASYSVQEDFAESVTAYRFTPSKLKAKSPKKYAFIKSYVFANLEFDKESSCINASDLLEKIEIYEKSIANLDINFADSIQSVLKTCRVHKDKVNQARAYNNEFLKCIELSISIEAFSLYQKKQIMTLPRFLFDPIVEGSHLRLTDQQITKWIQLITKFE